MSYQTFPDQLRPLVEQIQSEQLRQAVVSVWESLLEKSKWDSFEAIPCDLGLTAIPLVQETRNVTNYVIRAAQVYDRGYDELSINMDYLIAGSLLHNVSRIMEYRPILGGAEKTEEGQIYAEQFLGISEALHYGIPTEVIHMIVSDTSKINMVPATPEALILYFCTRIDMDVRNKMAGLPLRAKDKNYTITHQD